VVQNLCTRAQDKGRLPQVLRAKNNNGVIPLGTAAHFGHVDVLRVLLPYYSYEEMVAVELSSKDGGWHWRTLALGRCLQALGYLCGGCRSHRPASTGSVVTPSLTAADNSRPHIPHTCTLHACLMACNDQQAVILAERGACDLMCRLACVAQPVQPGPPGGAVPGAEGPQGQA
jgi:hypothetical protein